MKSYIPTIGLEIHAELKTRTKMFCNSKNDTDEKRPNVNICPVCMGHPGTLPTINKEAVKQVLKVGLACGGELADFTEFDRKNYFYPDIPKGYQISQYKFPLVKEGSLAGISLTRIHLEEDTGTLIHADNTAPRQSASLVNFNRAGVPLMELVTLPVIHSAEEASRFAKELQLLLQYLGVAEANMEKGEMRVEANISVSPKVESRKLKVDQKKDDSGSHSPLSTFHSQNLGTKVEVKNLNSFRAVEKAIKYEVARHIELLEAGEKVVQETRGWDENKEETFSQRQKEDSHDYRYFPDPDLPKLYIREIREFKKEILQKELPELPWQRRDRYKKEFGLKDAEAEIYVSMPEWGIFLEAVAKELSSSKEEVKLASNYISSDLIGLVKRGKTTEVKPPNPEPGGLTSARTLPLPSDFAALIRMIADAKVSSRAAKDILKIMHEEGGKPATIAARQNLLQKSDEEELKKIVERILADNQTVVSDYKAGKKTALQFLIGKAMKATKGSANPEILKKLLTSLL